MKKFMFCVLLILGCLPVSVFAAGVQGGGAAVRSTHSHDMSVECGNDAPLDYIPLTGDVDGKLYINGTEATTSTSGSSAGDYILPEGNYYLAENITVHQGVVIPQEKTVNLCLNGKTLQIQTETEQERERIQIEEQGTFCLSDCEGGGRITSGFNVLEPSSQGKFIMYGGCLESTMTAGTVIFMTNSNASAEIYGGTIKSDKGVGIASDEWTQCELHLSGNPVFEGNMVDVNPYVTLYLDALERNRNERIKVSREIELSVGESQSLDSIRSSDGVDYSTVLAGRAGQYFTYKNDEYFLNRAGVTRQPTPEEVSVDVLPAEGAAYQWYEAAEQDVTADRTIENMSEGGMSATMFTLQAGDILYFTLPETPTTSEDGGDAVMLYTMEQDMIFVTSLGNRRYKGTVESDVTFMIVYETESSSFNVGLFEEGTYEVRAVTQGDAVVGQTTDTFTKVESGVYLCKITWENLGCDVNSDIVELTFTDAEKVADAKSVVEKALEGIMVTNGTTKENIQSVIDKALTDAGISDVTVTVGELTVKEATKSEEGSIGGTVTIECGSETDNVTVNKPIAKLPVTDADKVAAKAVVEEVLADYTATNDSTGEDIQNLIDKALTDAGISDVTVTVGELTVKEATKSEEGSIGGTVTIECGSETDNVTVNKPIAKLPVTDADKVAAAKAVVEEALAGITATNKTKKEEIQSVIDKALTDAGISDVTVTVGELTVKEATKSEEGSIGGTVTIECGSEEDSVPVNKTIAKLPVTDADKVAAAKAVVEKALAGITATNKTKKEEIQSVIDKALTDAGISDVTVTVGELTVKEATKSEEGSIGGTVTIECGSETDNVTVNKPIAKLPVTDADKVAAAKAVVEKVLTGYTATNKTKKEEIQSVIDKALTEAEITGVTVIVGDLTKIDATEAAAGRISGSITITSGSETDSVVINKSIEKLLKTDAEKVAEAKSAVEKTLEGITVTNETTKEDIQSVIDTALSKVGISDVTVTAGDLSKTEATTSAEGSIRGTVTIQCGSEIDSVVINKSIAKLPEDTKLPENSIITPKQQEKNNLAIMAGTKVSQTGKKISIRWGKVKGADGYQVYVAYCGKNFSTKPTKTVESASATKVSVEKLNGKKLNLKKNYKVYIAAYKTVDGKKAVIGKTVVCHIVGKNNHAYTNVKGIKLAKSKFTLKKGKTAKIKAKIVLVDKKKKQLSNAHATQFRYATSNKEVATVSKEGKIKAVGKGSCTIYVYARNGYAKKIKISVK